MYIGRMNNFTCGAREFVGKKSIIVRQKYADYGKLLRLIIDVTINYYINVVYEWLPQYKLYYEDTL